jgi:hypothetical protein
MIARLTAAKTCAATTAEPLVLRCKPSLRRLDHHGDDAEDIEIAHPSAALLSFGSTSTGTVER